MLRADTRIDCNSSTYSMIFYEAVFMAVVFVLGVPGFWLCSLRNHRADIQQTGDDGEVSVAAQQFSFLVGAFLGTRKRPPTAFVAHSGTAIPHCGSHCKAALSAV